MSFLERLRDRKLGQWALAYIAGAWVVLQVMDVLSDPLNWSDRFQQGVLVVIVAGFFATLVLAWHHGEKGRQRVGGLEILSLAAVLLLAGVGLSFLPRPMDEDSAAVEVDVEPTAPRDRVAVLTFENLTGSPELTDVGLAAAHLITDGLDWMGGVTTVAPQAIRYLQADDGTASARTVAAEVGAGTVVTGVLTLRGDTLDTRAQVTSTASGDIIATVHASGLRADPMAVVHELRERVMVAVEATLDATWASWGNPAPPTYASWQIHARAIERFMALDWASAGPLYREAYRADTTFVYPLVAAATCYSNDGQYLVVDTLLAAIAPRRDELNPNTRAWFDFYLAQQEGDREAQLRIARVSLHRDPNAWGYIIALLSLRAGRPEEAVEAIEQVDLEDPRWQRVYFPWAAWARASHLVGQYETELDVALRGQERFPDLANLLGHEIQARVLLGSPEGVARLLDRLELLSPETGPEPGTVLSRVAAELSYHGHSDVAAQIATRAVHWHETKASSPAGLGAALLLAGRPDAAIQQLGVALAGSPEAIRAHGAHGVANVRSGRRESAQRDLLWLETVDRPYLNGAAAYWRAAISAHLGSRDEAVHLLREAVQQGRDLSSLHADFWLEPLWRDSDFEALNRPGGE